VKATVRAASHSSLALMHQPTSWTNDRTANAAVQLKLVDSHGAAIANANITATATRVTGSGSLALTNDHATTDASGIASFDSLQVLGPVGNFKLAFHASGYDVADTSTSAIELVAGSAHSMAASTAATLVQTAGPSRVDATNAPAVVIKDVSGNTVSGATPAWGFTDPCSIDISLGAAAASDAAGIAKAPSIGIPAGVPGSCSLVAALNHDGKVDSVDFSLAVVAPHTVVYTGNSRSDRTQWSDPDNWSGHQLPGTRDRVMINASVAAKGVPILDLSSATIGSLTIENGGALDLNGKNLTIGGDLTTVSSDLESVAQVYGDGTLTLTGGSGSTLSGLFPNAHVVVGGTSCGGTDYTVSFAFAKQVTVQCPLRFADTSVVLTYGNFETQLAGTIQMTSATSFLEVASSAAGPGHLTFNGGDERGLISAGQLVLEGDFTQSGNANTFVATDSNQVFFFGAADAPQHIHFDSPGPEASRFASLTMGFGPTTSVIGETSVVSDQLLLDGTLTMNASTTISAADAVLGETSIINGPGLASFSTCTARTGATVNIRTALGSIACAVGGLTHGSSIRPRGGASLSLQPQKRASLTSSSRPVACAILRRLNRVPERSIQAACPR
jgi:hypothetical protein